MNVQTLDHLGNYFMKHLYFKSHRSSRLNRINSEVSCFSALFTAASQTWLAKTYPTFVFLVDIIYTVLIFGGIQSIFGKIILKKGIIIAKCHKLTFFNSQLWSSRRLQVKKTPKIIAFVPLFWPKWLDICWRYIDISLKVSDPLVFIINFKICQYWSQNENYRRIIEITTVSKLFKAEIFSTD